MKFKKKKEEMNYKNIQKLDKISLLEKFFMH